MELNINDQIFLSKSVPAQDELVPFIGDLADLSTLDFTSPANLKLITRSVDITSHLFIAELDITEIDLKNVEEQYSHIIVGVEFQINPDGLITQTVNGTWKIALPDDVPTVTFDIDEPYMNQSIILKSYIVSELSDFSRYLSNSEIPNNIVTISTSNKVQGLLTLVSDRSTAYECIQTSDRSCINTVTNFLNELFKQLMTTANDAIFKMESDSWLRNTIILVKNDIRISRRVQDAEKFLESAKQRIEKRQGLEKMFAQRGIEYIWKPQFFDRAINRSKSVIALFFTVDSLKIQQDTMDLFLKFKNTDDESTTFIAVDMDEIKSSFLGGSKVPKPSVIRQYEFGRMVVANCEKEIKNIKENIAKINDPANFEKNVQTKRKGRLTAPCPKNCNGDNICEWKCFHCQQSLFYGFDDKFYCICGAANINNFSFKCTSQSHGVDFKNLTDNFRLTLKSIKPMRQVNILILGPSGVGKSTWINSVVNYLQFNSFDDAKKHEALCPIPAKFTIANDQMDSVEVHIGDGMDDDDNLAVGASVTQVCSTYSVEYEDKVINLLDTPGVGDTRGPDQDKKNFKFILDHIRHIDEMHAICVLLKPNEARITTIFEYCVKGLMANLHQSCANNLMFCFTRARETFYRPGETFTVLKELFAGINCNLRINDRVFCLDNEAFRYLCCKNLKGVTFSSDEHDSFAKSWDRSVAETKRLIEFALRQEPHKTTDTLSVNHARRMIYSLTKPMAEITKTIQINIEQINTHKEAIRNNQDDRDSLLKQLYIPFYTLEAIPLGYPRTICTAESCVKYADIDDSTIKNTLYVTHCHPQCYLQNVVPETYPNKDLLGCAAMNGTQNCLNCSCSWSVHMHIHYEQKMVKKHNKLDPDTQHLIDEKASLQAIKNKAIEGLERQVDQLKREEREIVNVGVLFAHFLQAKAIIPINDVFDEYLEFLINREKEKAFKTETDKQLLKQLCETKELYENEKLLFDQAKVSQHDVGPNEIQVYENKLYNMPLFGSKIRDIVDIAVKAENDSLKQNIKHINPTTKKNTPVNTNTTTNQGRGGKKRGKGRGGNSNNNNNNSNNNTSNNYHNNNSGGSAYNRVKSWFGAKYNNNSK